LIEFIERDGGAPLGALDAEIVRIDELLAHQRAGACTIDDAVERFVRDRGVAPTGYADEYRRIALASVDAFVVPLPGARDCFEHLRARAVPHAILTNGWAPLQQRKAARIGFGGAVLASSEIGSQKPDAAAFAALAGTLGCAADGIGYIGDNPVVDVAGALAAGMQGIWLDAEGASYPSTVPGPSRVIHSLHEVLALVRP
jgi:FMN phosphatase YigB (HAD superfamily)